MQIGKPQNVPYRVIGEPTGNAAPAFAAVVMYAGSFIGIIDEFREFREMIVASPGYTPGVGDWFDIVTVQAIP